MPHRRAYITAVAPAPGKPRNYAIVFGQDEAEARHNLTKPALVHLGKMIAHSKFPHDELILIEDQFASALEGWLGTWPTVDSYGRFAAALLGPDPNQGVLKLPKQQDTKRRALR